MTCPIKKTGKGYHTREYGALLRGGAILEVSEALGLAEMHIRFLHDTTVDGHLGASPAIPRLPGSGSVTILGNIQLTKRSLGVSSRSHMIFRPVLCRGQYSGIMRLSATYEEDGKSSCECTSKLPYTSKTAAAREIERKCGKQCASTNQ